MGENGFALVSAVALLLFVLAGVGLILGSASTAYGLGRLLVKRTSSPALLIASRRMIAAPFTASRACTAVVLTVILAAAVQGTRSIMLLFTDPRNRFYADTFTLLNIVLMMGIGIAVAGLLVITVESVITRRRTLAALVAAGTPHRTLAVAMLLETLLPLAPTVVFATVTGLFAARGFFGTTAIEQTGPPDELGNYARSYQGTAAIPWVDLTILAGGTLIAAALMTAIALPLLRRSTSVSELRAAA